MRELNQKHDVTQDAYDITWSILASFVPGALYGEFSTK